MNRPRTPAPAEVPEELRGARAWCAWGRVGDSDKVPLGADGRPADVQNSNPGMTLTEALRAARRVKGGVGLCLYGTPFAAVDCDGAYGEDGSTEEWAARVLSASGDLYVETSPSGRGFHAIGLASWTEQVGKTNARAPGDKGQGVEVFVGMGYLTFTGSSELGPPKELGSATKAIAAARAVAASWSAASTPREGPGAKVRLTVSAPAPDRLTESLAVNPSLRATWDGSRSDLKSASEYDLALASWAAGAGLSRQEAWDAVIAGRVRRGDDVTKALRADYAERTLKRAFSGAAGPRGVRPHGIGLTDFWAYLPQARYVHRPSRELWGPRGVSTVLPSSSVPGGLKATTWLDRNRHVEQMTWAPGEPEVIEGRYIQEGGWHPHGGARVYNTYRPPRPAGGDAGAAGPWLDLLRALYPEEADDLLDWMAHRAQRPDEKINHAIVLGGAQGVGKDTLLHPLRVAVGPWNFIEVSPTQITGQFNGFVKSVVLRVSEAHDLGNMKKFAFYDHTKTLTASPPETIRVNEKHRPEQQIPNLCGVVITTNHSDGLYLPPEDRRHLVCWAKADKGTFGGGYWTKLWSWYGAGGAGHVCALLRGRDISAFDPKAPPQRTNAFRAMVETGRPSEHSDFADALEALGGPDAVTFAQVAEAAEAGSEIALWAGDRKSSWMIKKRMVANGYEMIANEGSDARWMVAGKKVNVYAKAELHLREQHEAVQILRAEAAAK